MPRSAEDPIERHLRARIRHAKKLVDRTNLDSAPIARAKGQRLTMEAVDTLVRRASKVARADQRVATLQQLLDELKYRRHREKARDEATQLATQAILANRFVFRVVREDLPGYAPDPMHPGQRIWKAGVKKRFGYRFWKVGDKKHARSNEGTFPSHETARRAGLAHLGRMYRAEKKGQ